ncbi:FecR domain-containing protein [Opitutus terrae]|uniref:FecR protein domain-containing protein n=1 Tax=Opitutus terrae (strain DSM 11246 / JCM 15787 / PB90-1) TaxID=452637 RepID=B1ZZ71_OPITP|nr:FecR domain-containing protein [Opitutus terrae]ACB77143.1 hypothetical protein Oter_3869 [Opitutus terrae PB90-1]
MKLPPLFCFLGLLLSAQSVGFAALGRQNNILGKFVVTSVNGTATCVSDGRILELKKGDAILARGAVITTAPKSNVVLVFSNGTGVYTDESTTLRIERFEQEFFAPNNNLRVEPSNSTTMAKLTNGRVIISTPRLLSATVMNYQTPHASVMVRGEKILIEASDKQTHVAMIAGNATVNPRDTRGNFVAVGKRLVTGQEAFVKPTINASDPDAPASVDVSNPAAPAAAPNAAPAAKTAAPAPAAPAPTAPQAVVLSLSGTASTRAADSSQETALTAGALLAENSIVITGDASEVHLQPFVGAIATVQPNSVVQIERLSVPTAPAAKRSVTLALRAGGVVSMIDPARRFTNEYQVRTPQGLAEAHGTAFAASLAHGGFSLAATADTVSFTTTSGTHYQISAGNVVVTGPGRDPQPPVPLAQAVAGDPAFRTVIEDAFSTAVSLTRNNVGSLPAGSSLNLLTKITASAAAALPDQAERFVTEALNAIAAPSSPMVTQAGPSVGAVIHAITAAVPGRAPALAAAAARAFPSQAAAIAAAAAKAAPAQAAQITLSVIGAVAQPDPASGVSASSLQTAATVAAAVTSSTVNQAGPIAAAALQAVLQNGAARTSDTTARQAALIAATVTRAAPGQAIQVARAMMQALTQELTEATPQTLARMSALLAGSIIAVVPPQAQPVATAVMRFLVEAYPNVSSGAMAEIAGLVAGTAGQIVPDRAAEVAAGVADVLGVTADLLQASVTRSVDLTGQIVAEIIGITQESAVAFQHSTAAANSLVAGLQLAESPMLAGAALGEASGLASAVEDPTRTELNAATSIIITQFDPEQVAELTSDLEAAQTAQTTVQFYTESTSDGGTTVRPAPTIPRTIPVETTASPSTAGF